MVEIYNLENLPRRIDDILGAYSKLESGDIGLFEKMKIHALLAERYLSFSRSNCSTSVGSAFSVKKKALHFFTGRVSCTTPTPEHCLQKVLEHSAAALEFASRFRDEVYTSRLLAWRTLAYGWLRSLTDFEETFAKLKASAPNEAVYLLNYMATQDDLQYLGVFLKRELAETKIE